MNLCWRAGEFLWQNPATGEYLRTRDEIRRDEIEAPARAEAAEEWARLLEAELRRLRGA